MGVCDVYAILKINTENELKRKKKHSTGRHASPVHLKARRKGRPGRMKWPEEGFLFQIVKLSEGYCYKTNGQQAVVRTPNS